MNQLKEYWRRTDMMYLLLCLFCSVMSVLVLLSIGKYVLGGFATNADGTTALGGYSRAVVQGGASVLGLLFAVVISCIDYRSMAKLWPFLEGIAWLLVALTFLKGKSLGPFTFGFAPTGTENYSWILLPGGLSLQPTELAKITFILSLAIHLNTYKERINQPLVLLGVLAHMALPVLVVHFQGDDGTALVFLAIGLMMLFMAGLSWKYILSAAALGAVGLFVAVYFFSDRVLKGYQFMRIMAVLYPDDEQYKQWAYQQNGAKISIGAGRIFGRGLFSGEHNYVANSWNDFIFSYMAEAIGFVGSALVLVVLFTIAIKTLRIGLRSQDVLGTYICAGIFGALAWQIIINVGMNTQVLPVIGVTLPFFSSGGSSVLMLYLCVGLVLSVHMHNKKNLFD